MRSSLSKNLFPHSPHSWRPGSPPLCSLRRWCTRLTCRFRLCWLFTCTLHSLHLQARIFMYRMTHLLSKNLPLTWIWDVLPSCLEAVTKQMCHPVQNLIFLLRGISSSFYHPTHSTYLAVLSQYFFWKDATPFLTAIFIKLSSANFTFSPSLSLSVLIRPPTKPRHVLRCNFSSN